MKKRRSLIGSLVALLVLACSLSSFGAYVFVEDAGNAADGDTTYGSVDMNYYIGQTEVTNAEYAAFLNDVAATDTYGLYNTNMGTSYAGGILRSGTSGSYTYAVKSDFGNKPVNFVSILDAARYVNWLNLNESLGTDMNNAAYTITGTSLSTRNADMLYYLPTRNEWFKAAYYNGSTDSYYNYATQQSTPPSSSAADPSGNILVPDGPTANYGSVANWNGSTTGNVTTVKSAGSESYYGTYDQNGNVAEWTDTVVDGSYYAALGGSYSDFSFALHKGSVYFASSYTTTTELGNIGFRVYRVPEPGAFVMALFAGCAALIRRRRRQ